MTDDLTVLVPVLGWLARLDVQLEVRGATSTRHLQGVCWTRQCMQCSITCLLHISNSGAHLLRLDRHGLLAQPAPVVHNRSQPGDQLLFACRCWALRQEWIRKHGDTIVTGRALDLTSLRLI